MNHEREITGLCAWQNNKLEVSKITVRLRNIHSWCAQVHSWVKWPEHESDHKTLSNAELTSGAVIICVYMNVGSI
jgi:hypothetical protein